MIICEYDMITTQYINWYIIDYIIDYQNNFKKRRLFFENLGNPLIKIEKQNHLLQISTIQYKVKSTWYIYTQR